MYDLLCVCVEDIKTGLLLSCQLKSHYKMLNSMHKTVLRTVNCPSTFVPVERQIYLLGQLNKIPFPNNTEKSWNSRQLSSGHLWRY